MDTNFYKHPYDTLEGIKFFHLLAGAVAIGFAIITAYYFTLFSATNTKLTGVVKKVDFLAVEGELSKLYRSFKIHTPPSLPSWRGIRVRV